MRSSNFQIIILGIFGIAIIVGVLLFSGVLPGFRAPAGAAGGKLALWGPLPADDLAPFLSSFNQKYKSRFTLVYSEKPADNFEASLIDAIASGQSPDLVFLPQDLIVRQANKFIPFTEKEMSPRTFKDNFIAAGEIYLAAGGAIGLPVLADPLALYWNRNLFSVGGVAGPPVVWSELVKNKGGIIKKLTIFDPKNAVVQSAIPLGDAANVNHSKEILATLIMQAGSPIAVWGDKGYQSALVSSEVTVQSPAQAALDFFIQFADPARTTYTWNRSLPNSLESFAGGLTAMYLGWASEWRRIRDNSPLINFDVAVMPQRDRSRSAAFANLLAVAVPRSSPKIVSAKVAALLIADNAMAWDLAQAAFWPPARRDLLARSNKDPFLATFYKAALIGQAWPDPDTDKTREIFDTMAEAVLTGRLKSGEAVNRAQEELTLIIKSANTGQK